MYIYCNHDTVQWTIVPYCTELKIKSSYIIKHSPYQNTIQAKITGLGDVCILSCTDFFFLNIFRHFDKSNKVMDLNTGRTI